MHQIDGVRVSFKASFQMRMATGSNDVICRRERVRVVATFVCVSISVASLCKAEGTIDDVVSSSILRTHNAVRAIDVTYTAKTPNDSVLDAHSFIRTRFVANGRRRFRDTIHWTARRGPLIDTNHLRQVFTGSRFDVFYVPSRLYEISSATTSSLPPWKVRHDLILNCLGWWPKEDDPPPTNDETIARHLRFICTSGKYHVERSEVVDGALCRVVASRGRDTLWLDPAKEHAIRKREVFDSVTGVLLRRQRSSDFVEKLVATDTGQTSFWYPRRILIESLANTADNPQAKTIEIDVTELNVNLKNDQVFEIVPPPGTIISNRDSGSIQHIPGGIELLDDTVTMADSILQLVPHKRVRALKSSYPTGGFALTYGVLALCAGSAAFISVRGYRNHRQTSVNSAGR